MKNQTALRETDQNCFLNSPQYLSLPDFLTTKEVAVIIHKSPAWLERKRTEGGGIPFRKIGHHVLYLKYDVFEFLYSAPILESTSGNNSTQLQVAGSFRKEGEA